MTVPGRPFLCHLIDLTIGIVKPHFHIRLGQEARLDLAAWSMFIENLMGHHSLLTISGFLHKSHSCLLTLQVHKRHDLDDPAVTFVVRKLLHGAARLKSSGDQRAPVTQSVLYQLVRSTPKISLCYYNNILTSAMYLLAFHAFLLIREIAVTSTARISNVLQVNQVAVTSSAVWLCFTYTSNTRALQCR